MSINPVDLDSSTTRTVSQQRPGWLHQHHFHFRASMSSLENNARQLMSRAGHSYKSHREVATHDPAPSSPHGSPAIRIGHGLFLHWPGFGHSGHPHNHGQSHKEEGYFDTEVHGFPHSATSSNRSSYCETDDPTMTPAPKRIQLPTRPSLVSRTSCRRNSLSPLDFPDPIKDLYIFRNPACDAHGYFHSCNTHDCETS